MRAIAATSNVLVSELDQKIQLAKQKQLTGVLLIKSSVIHQWRLYFLAGQLVWATTRTHAKRRWFRQLLQHQPDLRRYGLSASSEWTYGRLARLVICKKFNRTAFSKIVAGYIAEVLFDLQQQGTFNFQQTGRGFIYRIKPQKAYNLPYVNLQTIQIWEQAKREWQAWEYAELTQIDPNDALEINDLAMLEDLASPQLVQLLNSLVDGNHTLRDLALQANQSLMPFVLSIFPHLRNRSLQLKSVGDIITQARPVAQNNIVVKFERTIIPKDARIVYVDNNLIDSQTMATIIEAAGHRYSNIPDPLEVLKKLVELQPKVIFLNLTMPVTNGYELCAQIRRLSGFKDTPIVMVGSGNNSVAERMRARMVGASEFLSKPIRPKTVLKTLIVLGVI
ncbi:response regulator receiver protein [Leptolyngbya sp. Heron Island J]|uniref:response regulator n=1 Tax=Leptolyngbya sp. Heron Island J TaxID=1385935 RepID=UPI0003B990ED|nr:response regulator [Leptolyngbya sp. Heron Island J]ESA34474.1 response regulator receiver protein [Leptolyngbya sp. Heron Island J]